MNILSEVRNILLKNGASLVGFANTQNLNLKIKNHFTLGISIAVALEKSIVKNITDGPTIEYYNEYIRVNKKLDYLSNMISTHLLSKGYKTEFWGATEDRIYGKHLTDLPHKTMATLSGLGWIGKCALLVTKKYGSALRLTTVLTNIPEKVEDKSIKESSCKDCTICTTVCPSHAPSGKNWNQKLYRDNFFNVDLCRINAKKISKDRIGIDNTICGICMAHCPYTVNYVREK